MQGSGEFKRNGGLHCERDSRPRVDLHRSGRNDRLSGLSEPARTGDSLKAVLGRSVAATEARFKAGDVGRYEALGATVAAAQAEVAYAQAQAGWHVATLRVVSALGGDWRQQR